MDVNVATGNVKRRVKDGGVAFDTVSRGRAVQVRVQLKCGQSHMGKWLQWRTVVGLKLPQTVPQAVPQAGATHCI
jgi:hypothetical protein